MPRHATFHDLEGRSVFITGGGSGIGAALTEGFLAQGARVAFVQRSDATPLVEDLRSRHGRAPLFLPCDVTDIPALRAAMAAAAEAHGPITVLVNNAARDDRHAVEGYTVEEWDRAQDINLRPHFFTAQAAAPGMKAAGGGSIINMSSVASSLKGVPNRCAYSASKAAVIGLTKSLGKELAKTGVLVNAVTPAAAKTPIFDSMTPQHIEFMLSKIPMNRFLEVDEAAAMICWLSTEDCAFSTGAVFDLSGGRATY